MSNKHLNDLRNALYANGWDVFSEEEGDDYSISGIWVIFSRKYVGNIRIVFEGLGDLSVLPIDKSYACYIDGDSSSTLYFSKNNQREWKIQLSDFISKLNNHL